jgi:uncharacterized protein YggE
MRYLRLVILGVGIVLVAAACGTPEVTVQNVPAAEGDVNSIGISVSGRGEVFGTPDTLTINLGVSVLRDDVSTATGDAADLAERLIAALTNRGVEDRDVQTSNYSIHPEYDWSGEQRRLVGYRVNNTVSAKIRDLDRAGEIIDAATAAGGDDVVVNGLSFSLEDNDELIVAAREAAWQDALAKAQQLASLSGTTLGTPVSISESFSSEPPPIYYERAPEAGADAAFTPIEPGQETVTVNLQVRFAIDG